VKLHELAELICGQLKGDGGMEVTGVAGLSEATASEVSFVASEKNVAEAAKSNACCLVVSEFHDKLKCPQIIVEDPELVFFNVLLEKLRPRQPLPRKGVSELAFIDPEASLADDVSVLPYAYISAGASVGPGTTICAGVFIGAKTVVGSNCLLYPNVVLMDGVTLGNSVTVHAGSVIGSDGYGYMQRKGVHVKKPQVGGVIVSDNVEIGANCAIDRATTGNTVIGAGTKLDNLVHVAHNVTVGEGSLLTGQVGIAGSTKIGKYVILAGQSGVKDHVEVADNAVIAAKSAVLGDIKEAGMYGGSPAIPINTWLRSSAAFTKLPELIKTVRRLEKRLDELEKKE